MRKVGFNKIRVYKWLSDYYLIRLRFTVRLSSLLLRLALWVASHGKTAILPFDPALALARLE